MALLERMKKIFRGYSVFLVLCGMGKKNGDRVSKGNIDFLFIFSTAFGLAANTNHGISIW